MPTKTFKFTFKDANDEATEMIISAEGFGSLSHATEWAHCNAALMSAQATKFIYISNIVEVGGDTPSFLCNTHPSYWTEGIKTIPTI